MKAIREARLIGMFLLMIALDTLLKSHFSMSVLATLSVPFFIHWFFNWDEAKYQYFEKKELKNDKRRKIKTNEKTC